MKKVLCIAHDFPPRRTSGVYRITGMTKYLGQFGWRPTVLTIEQREDDFCDSTLLQRVPANIEIVRTKYIRMGAWEDPVASGLRKFGGLQSSPDGRQQPVGDRLIRSLGSLVRSTLYFPDDTVGWIPFGLAKAIHLHRKHRFDVVYCTSPPRTALVIGLFLKLLLRVPFVAESRDPWNPPGRPIRDWFEHWLQHFIFDRCDRLVLHSEGYAREVINVFAVPQDKIAVISNGYDETDFASDNLPGIRPFSSGYVNMSHFGTIYPGRVGKFFSAVKDFLKQFPEERGRLRVNIVGHLDEQVRRYAQSDELKDVIVAHKFMGHAQALEAMRSSDCLIIFWGDPYYSQRTVAGKLYEYLRVGRPILAVDCGGETTQIIRDGNAGWAVAPNDSEGIKHVLQTLLGLTSEQRPLPCATPEYAAQFRYDRLAAKLASVFDSVLSHGA
jgi:glycosyltransferase involved in cell wall biosynthesis